MLQLLFLMFGIFVFVESGLLLAVLALSFIGVIFAISTITNMPPYISAPILIIVLLLNKNKNAKWIQAFMHWFHKSKIIYFIKEKRGGNLIGRWEGVLYRFNRADSVFSSIKPKN